jgi:hypothetical protein
MRKSRPGRPSSLSHWGIAVASLCFLIGLSARGETDVTVLTQIHYIAQLGPKNDIPALAKSQFAILKVMNQNRHGAYFSEGLVEDIRAADLDPSLVSKVKAAFPSGIPQNFDQLTDKQVELLGTSRAAQVGLALGYVKELHATSDPKTARENRIRFDAFVAEGAKQGMGFLDLMTIAAFRSIVLDERENVAAQKIEAFLNAEGNRGKKIFLIFGENHDFSKRNDANLVFKNHDFSKVCDQHFSGLVPYPKTVPLAF